MTAATLRKYRNYLVDDKGKTVMVQLDLRNKLMRQAYERVMEDLEDMLDMAEATKRLEDGSELIPWEEAKKHLYQKTEEK